MVDSGQGTEKLEADNAGWARTAKDLFAGAAGGVAQVLLGEFTSRFACQVFKRGRLSKAITSWELIA